MAGKAGLPVLYLQPGSTILWCRFTVNGVRVRESTGHRDEGAATAEAQRIYAEASLGRSAKPKWRHHRPSANTPLIDLAAHYIVWTRANGKADSYVVKQEMHFRAHFCSRWQRLEQVTGKAIEKYKVDRQAEDNGRGGLVGLTTTYKELVTLSRFLRWCKRQGHLVEVPEFDRFRPVSNYRPPDLTAEVVRTLLAELPDQKTHHNRRPVREFFTVQWAQAMRPGEVMTLTWQDVDLERKRVTVRAANDKARAGRTIGLADEAYQTLKTLAKAPHLTTARIFDRCDYRVSLRLAGVKVGLPDVTPHHLRHARLSEMASVTRDVAAVQYMAGHKNLSTTDRYVRSRTERTEGLIKALSDIVSMPRSKKRKRAKS